MPRDRAGTAAARLRAGLAMVSEPARARVVALILLLLLALLAFEEVADDVFDDLPAGDLEAMELDARLAGWLRSFRAPWLNQVMMDLTALGSVSVLVAFTIAMAAVLVMSRDRAGLLHLLVLGAGAIVIPHYLKLLFARPRPEALDQLVTVTSLSFPSGHAFGAAAIYSFFVLHALRHVMHPLQRVVWIGFTVLVITLIGVSRVYLGVHHATDVLAGTAAGAAWSFAVALVFEIPVLRSTRATQPDP